MLTVETHARVSREKLNVCLNAAETGAAHMSAATLTNQIFILD